MNGEHDTPIGTPVVIAPGKIFLVGEYAVLDEGCAVLAAITLHAKAQFIPRMDAMPPMVSELVRRAKTELGEAASALPPGSVLVNADDFHSGHATGGLGSSAAIAVATVGSVYESLGLAIEEHRQQIFAIADAGRRTAQGDVGSGADTAVATHGGLVQVTRHKDTLPRIDYLTAPAGLHLVPFSAGRSISTRQMTVGLRAYARDESTAFEYAMASLREIAHRFVAELTAGRATGAVVAAGRYGEELARLSAAASVPIVTTAFEQASNLARELGGIAKPIGAGGGEIGLAMFATPEAAQLFRTACTNPLVPLAGDLEPCGVRCHNSEKTSEDAIEVEEAVVEGGEVEGGEVDESEGDASPEPIVIEPAPVRALARIVVTAEELDTVRERKADELVTVRIGELRGRRRRRIISAAAIVLAAAAAWYAFPRTAGIHGKSTPKASSTGEASHPFVAIPQKGAASPEGIAAPEETAAPADVRPAAAVPEAPTLTPAHEHGHRFESTRHPHGAPSRGQASASRPRSARPARRAGNLSADDF